eukprot:g23261.t1
MIWPVSMKSRDNPSRPRESFSATVERCPECRAIDLDEGFCRSCGADVESVADLQAVGAAATVPRSLQRPF